MGIDGRFEHIFADAVNGFADIRNVQQFVTLTVDCATLIVSNIIIFQQLLTNIKVAAFDFTLCVSDGLGDPRVLNRFAWFHPQLAHHAGDTVGGKDTHQSIFHRQVEAGRTGIPLTTRTAAQLVIDTTGFMTLGTDNMQAACCQNGIVTNLPVGFNLRDLLRCRIFQRSDFSLPAPAEHNIRTTTSHVGGDGHR